MKMRRSNLINDPLWEWVLSPRYGTSSHFQTPRNRMDGRGQERAHRVWSLRNEVINRAKSREKIRKADSTMWDQAGKTERYRGIYVISTIPIFCSSNYPLLTTTIPISTRYLCKYRREFWTLQAFSILSYLPNHLQKYLITKGADPPPYCVDRYATHPPPRITPPCVPNTNKNTLSAQHRRSKYEIPSETITR